MTSDVLAALTALAGSPPAPARPVPQQTLETVFGMPLPADYVRYVRTVPPGVYRDTLAVDQPDGDGSTAELEAALEFRRGQLRDDDAPEQLVPWAALGRDYLVCWIADGDAPDDWQVAVYEPNPFTGGTVHPFAGGCVDFVLAFAAGTTGLALLDYVYRHDTDDVHQHDTGPLFTAFPDRG